MFKKLINDDRSEEWNIIMYSVIFTILFLAILTPVVFIGLSMLPELAPTLTNATSNANEKMIESIGSMKAVVEMLVYGTIAEFLRRKKSMNFKITDDKATKFLFYFCVEMSLYIVFMILGGVMV